MRTRIKVTDLTLRQWDHLQDHLPASYDIPENAVRVCVEFELDSQLSPRHVEMPVRAFMALMTRLQRIEVHGAIEEGTAELPPLPAKWSAPLTGPALVCSHGAAVVNETPSAFEGGEPVRDYADGCQSVGPYRPACGCTPDQRCALHSGPPFWRDEATGLVSGGLVTDEG